MSIGDRVNGSNRSIIMQTCREDGVLLKPDRPATPLDSYWAVRAFGPLAHGPKGEVWTTETQISGFKWMYAFGTMLDEEFVLSLDELLHSSTRWSTEAIGVASPEYVAFSYYRGPTSVRAVDNSQPLRFATGPDYGSAELYLVAPRFPNGWALLGETDKYISVAQQRITSVEMAGSSVNVRIIGSPGERVSLSAVPPGTSSPSFFTEVIPESGTVIISLKSSEGIANFSPLKTLANYSAVLSPLPQWLSQPSTSVEIPVEVGPDWIIATDLDNNMNSFAASDLANSLLQITGGVRYNVLPIRAVSSQSSKLVIFGTTNSSSDHLLQNLLLQRNMSINDLGEHAGPEAYVLAVASDLVVILGTGDAGAFYGLQTLKQIWNASWLAGGCGTGAYCSIPTVRIRDWPELSIRGAHIHQLGDKEPSAVFYAQADRMAAHKMNFFSAMTTSNVPIDLDREADFLLAMQKYCLDRHLEFVPVVSLGTRQSQDSRTGEGIWARSVPFVVDSSLNLVPLTKPILPLLNPGFDSVDSDGRVSNWTVFTSENSTWTIDTSTSFSGPRSMRCDITVGAGVSSRLLSQAVTIEPSRTYQLSAYTKVESVFGDEPWVWLVQIDKAGNQISGGTHLPTGAQISNNGNAWTQITCTFVAEPTAAKFVVYVGLNGTTTSSTRFWIDEIMILSLDHALINVIRTNVTDLIIRPQGVGRNDSNAYYRQGHDYIVNDARAVPPLLPANFRMGQSGPQSLNQSLVVTLKGLSTGRLRPGALLSVDYDFQPGEMGFHTYDLYAGLSGHLPWPPNELNRGWVAPSFPYWRHQNRRPHRSSNLGSPHNDLAWSTQSTAGDFMEPLYYQFAINETLTLLDMFSQRGSRINYINLNYDEIQAVARDSRTLLSGLTNGELVARSINKITSAIKERYPNITILFWDDLLDPYHLHAQNSDQDNLQAQHYGREDGTLDHAMELVNDKTIIWLNWFYVRPCCHFPPFCLGFG